MSNPIKLAVDRQNRILVPYKGSVLQIPDLFQSNTQDMQISVVDPDPSGALGAYVAADMTSVGLRVSIGDTPTGTPGGPTPLALQDTWVWDATNKWFTASIAMNTSAIDTFLGTLASKSAYFEVNTTVSGSRMTIFQGQFTLKAVVDELTSNVPSPTDQYLTKAECLALFAKLIGDPGQHLVFVDPNGTYKREIGVNTDGTAIDNVYT